MQKLLLMLALICGSCSASKHVDPLDPHMKNIAICTVLSETIKYIYRDCIMSHYLNKTLNKTTASECEGKIDEFLAAFDTHQELVCDNDRHLL